MTPSFTLSKGKTEFILFNNLYTQTSFFNGDKEKVELDQRSSYYSGIFQFFYGVSSSFNIGFDIYLKSVRVDEESSSPFRTLLFEERQDSRTAITPMGPKIKFTPFKKLHNLSVQSTLLFPVGKDLEGGSNGKPFLDHQKYTWWTQVFFDTPLTSDIQLFTEADILWRIDDEFKYEESNFLTPIKLFISYFPIDKLTVYAMSEFTPTYGDDLFSAYYFQSGSGAKYQIMPSLIIELLYTNFLLGKNAGAGQTFNLGLRWLP